MNISSLLLHAQPQRAEHVRAHLEQLPGVEVHAVTAEGRLIVTVEKRDDLEMTRAFEQLGAIPGVHATTLVYHHSETLDDELPSKKECKP
jgi:nitrate reductase NapD